MGDTIEQSGWDLNAYQRNPVVLWAHDSTLAARREGAKGLV
jgi:hypothetical protein